MSIVNIITAKYTIKLVVLDLHLLLKLMLILHLFIEI